MKYLILIAFSTLWIHVSGEEINKMNIFLRDLSKDESKTEEFVSFLVRGDVVQITEFAETHFGKFRYAAGDIVSVSIQAKYLQELQSKSFVIRMEAFPKKMHLLNDTMRTKNHINEIHSGLSPLPQGYDGNGIVMGFIDTGIDFNHPDFKDSSGFSRIRYLWDMTKPLAANTPQPYNYGQEWNNQQIDSGLSTHNDLAHYGHGTHVAGVAVANGLAAGINKGVAPKSDIIMVAYDFSYGGPDPRIADAVNYIYSKAQAMGKPCAINASLGNYYGSHDATDLEAQMIENSLTPGRLYVTAVGNTGGSKIHVRHQAVPNDTVFTWFKYNSGFGFAYMEAYLNATDVPNMNFAVGVDMVNPSYSFRGRTGFFNVSSRTAGWVNDTIYVNGNRIGVVRSAAEISSGVATLVCLVYTDSSATDYRWRFISAGTGQMDSWGFDFESTTIPPDSVFPDIVNYVLPDTNSNMISSYGCSDKVVTVGNYYTTDRNIDYNNNLFISTGEFPNALVGNSSRGPTRDGRIKPDVTATGNHTMSCIIVSEMPNFIANAPFRLSPGGYHFSSGGSSVAAPVVGGLAALYLQRFPTATAQNFRDAVRSCAYVDTFTWGPIPNSSWGYGKVDGFATLLCSLTGLTETETESGLFVFPNPAAEEFIIRVPGSAKSCRVRIFDSIGRVVYDAESKGREIKINSPFKPGMYLVQVIAGNAIMSSRIIRQ